VFNFLKVSNRYFGGTALVMGLLEAWSKSWAPAQTIRILDLGTGAADIPVAIDHWAKARHRTVHITGVDLMPDVVALAQENSQGHPAIVVRQGDFFNLAAENQRYDYVIASLFLHHTSPDKAVHVLKTMDQLALRGIIISDLLRTRLSFWSIKLLCLMIGNKIVRHDGPLSVRRAFQPGELSTLALKAGLPYLKVRKHPWFRVSLAGEKIHGT
jgi:SAM-dependent methyltransferase